MDALKDGGPAFPVAGLSGLPNGDFINPEGGMTLRDYFAAHAQFDLSDARGAFHEFAGAYKKPSHEDLIRILVSMRMDYADAMLAAR